MQQIDQLLKTAKNIHFIGIGGSGMCPLAEILHAEGYHLTGSDNNETDTLARIRSLGIPVTLGQRAENIRGAEMIIHSAAIMKDNEELIAAYASGIPTFERSKLLGAISRMYENCIAVSGTHGKTTVTSMLTQILMAAKLDPTVVIGGKLPAINANGRVGKSEIMVCEACEFVDTFLELSPALSIILNIDADHLDYFGTLENAIHSFQRFAALTSKSLIINGDDANTLKAIEGITGKQVIRFGLQANNDITATNITLNENACAQFDLYKQADFLGHIELSVPGRHHVYNAMAAAVVALEIGASVDTIIDGLRSYTGAGRRFEILGVRNGITIADDYAHHPAELRATLEAAMEMPYHRVWAVFQPFTYSRTAMLMEDFARVLQIPQKVVMSEIMGSREKNTYNIYTAQLADKIPGSVWFPTFEEIADYIVANAQEGDLVLTLGCGDIYKAAKLMLKKYDQLDVK